ncbi:hypothetical protein [Amycolatopsis sp. NPDC058986]|uniref:hypothetical protein n=1 Tax=unclassified Amycolatopsis TaxID=2618356 RepID=UPI00366BC2DB
MNRTSSSVRYDVWAKITDASTRERCADSAFGCGAAGCELTAGGELGTAEELGALGSGAAELLDGAAVDGGAVETGTGSAPAGAANTPVNATAAANVARQLATVRAMGLSPGNLFTQCHP